MEVFATCCQQHSFPFNLKEWVDFCQEMFHAIFDHPKILEERIVGMGGRLFANLLLLWFDGL